MKLKKYHYFLIVFIAFFGLFFAAKTTSAGGIPGISELPSSEGYLSSIEEISAPILKQLADTFWGLIKAVAFLFVSSLLLDKAMEAKIDLGDLLVTTGWTFTLSLTNLIFIFVILYIAIKQIISSDEDMGSIKKYLPRLITTILLVNFGVVFVKMGLDLASILQRSMVPSGLSLALNSISSLKDQIMSSLVFLAGYFATGTIASGLSITAAFWQGMVFPASILMAPTIISAAIQTFVCTTLALTYLGFAGYFIIRIFIIKILTILFPLAFACYAIPNEGAQKLWKQWLNFFISWTFFAIPLLFFLVLGLKLLQGIVPAGMATLSTPFAFWQIFANQGLIADAMNYYIIMIGYLITLAYLKTKFTPKLDLGNAKGGVFDKGKNFVLNRIKPFANTTRQNLAMTAIGQREREKQKALDAPGSAGGNKWAKRAGDGINSMTASAIEKSFMAEGTTPELEINPLIGKQEKAYEKKFGKDTESASKIFSAAPSDSKTSLERIAQTSYLVSNSKGGKGVREALGTLGKQKTRELISDSEMGKRGDLADALRRSLVGQQDSGLKEDEIKKVVESSKGEEDMKQFSPGFEKDPVAIKKIMEFQSDQLEAATKIHRSGFLKEYVSQINQKDENDFKKFIEDHPGQTMFVMGTAGQRAGAILRDKGGKALDKESLQKIINAVKDGQESQPSQPPENTLHESKLVDKNGQPISASDIKESLEKASSPEPQKTAERELVQRPTAAGPTRISKRPPGTASGPERSDRRPPGT